MKRTVPISDAIQFGWNTFKANPLFLIGIYGAVTIIQVVMNRASEMPTARENFAVQAAIWIISTLLGFVLEMGLITIALKFYDQEKVEFSDLFTNAGMLLHYGLASILYGILVVFGVLFFIFPGIYVAVRFVYFGYFIVNKGASAFDSFDMSSRLTEGVRMELFTFGLLIVALNLAGLLALGVGLLVSMPVTHLAIAYVFRVLGDSPQDVESDVATRVA